jgi:hypothetical protein
MRNASENSRTPRHRHETAPNPEARETAEFWRLERKRQYELLAPPNVPHRRKEARRWLDELKVRCSNGCVWERRPDHRYISIKDGEILWSATLDALSRTDPELHRAVERVIFENVTRDLGISMDQWRQRSHRRSKHISKVRARMQRACLI